MNHPRMTFHGRRLAGIIGVLVAFSLPKRVDCGFPGNECARIVNHRECRDYEVEPFGFFLLESVFRRNIGFAYDRDDDCR